MRVELPPEPVHFVNRHDERERALRAIAERTRRSRPLVVSLSGPAGLGKSELAYLLARTVLDRHPDGVLTVDLDDHRLDGVLDPGDVLAQLLESLGVEPGLVAAGYKARCRQYWRLTADLSLVLVVDDVRHASELVPLLPASGTSTVIVASHGPLYDLEDGAALDLPLGPLNDAAAEELLGLIVRDERLAADPSALRALLSLCEGLPTALHVADRWIRAHRLRPLSGLIGELHGTWSERGLPEVERIWDTAYEALSGPAAALYRLLAHHPAPAFTPESATALLGQGADRCLAALEELDRAGLLDLRDPAGRLRLPGPLHAHARRRAHRDAPPGEVREAQIRALRWFTRQAQRADRFGAGSRLIVADWVDVLPDVPDAASLLDPAQAVDEADRTARKEGALRRLAAERHALFGCLRLAHALGHDAEAVALSEAIWTYALDHPGQTEVAEVQRLAVAAAVRSGNPRWIVRTRCQLARALWETGAHEEAGQELDHAESAAGLLNGTERRDRKLTASVIEFQGLLTGLRGDWTQALGRFAASREIHRDIDNAYGAMLQTYRMGEAHTHLGDLDTARDLLTEAHATARELGRVRMTRRTGFALAEVLLRQGRHAEARPLYEASLEGARGRNSVHDVARVHDALAALDDAEGRRDDAARHRARAHEIRRCNGLEQPER
ncbi:tetratricopeptide repeat protein [Streptomyces sp. NPDC050145]|uniref:tetratricopeptide repeat protein n=1 Tax=Streptomyces sp. NPDC050145 TaxID=3365602 RepID=UPI003790B9E5